ncbi:hypothetical protein MKK67_07155 [Methylobacterium sp. J-072]|uniref:hypothetical protein n=1 Tax=Methylobacterium sp. J-072 TaxID=2836651 RepID=UPI001FB9D3DC|nr:hypothetical protein [Methylobacterium sp. J-072]MCJ2092272.1 hypothetical protein [Methylobacterium sp. J-072]
MAETKREHDRVFQMRVSDAFLSTLDEWRRGQPDLPSRAEAVRRLVERGIVIRTHDDPDHAKGSQGAN